MYFHQASICSYRFSVPPLVALTSLLTTLAWSAMSLTSSARAQTAAPSGIITISVKDYGAVGDGKTDDTLALQKAINACTGVAVNSNLLTYVTPTSPPLPPPPNTPPPTAVTPTVAQQRYNLIIPAGLYKITSPLLIEWPTGYHTGITITGAGPSCQGTPLEGGTTIVMADTVAGAPRQDAIFEIGGGAASSSCISGMTLLPAGDTPYGVHFLMSQWSHFRLQDLGVSFNSGISVCTAVRVEAGPNGEDLILNNVSGNACICFYDMENGQGFNDRLENCSASILNGGTAIKIGLQTTGGFHTSISNFSGSGGGGPKKNSFLAIGQTNGSVTVRDTRYENVVDEVLSEGGGTKDMNGMVTFEDCAFEGIRDLYPLVTGGGTNAQYGNTFHRCRFVGGGTSPPALTVQIFRNQNGVDHTGAQGNICRYVWDECRFFNFSSVKLGIKPNPMLWPYTGYDGTVITNCWMDLPTAFPLSPVTN